MAALKNRAELAELVPEFMAEGVSMRQACIKAGLTAQTFLRAVDDSPGLAERYAQARGALLDAMVDQILALADAPVPLLDNGATDPGLVRQRQLQIDARRWVLSKLAPSKYGDRLDVQVSDSRISITGALAAAQMRLADVVDVTPRLAPPDADADADDAGGGRAKPKGPAVT
jgi:hypothetical protein